MQRRNIVTLLTSAPFLFRGLAAFAQPRGAQIIADLKSRQQRGQITSVEWVAEQVKAIPEEHRLKAAYGVVQSVPYRVTRWTGNPNELFSLGRGDCRHKTFCQMRLFLTLGIRVRHVKTRFDWADLPIPKPILDELPTTLGVHDSVVIDVGDEWVNADATWNPALAKLGFPVALDWDGRSPTPPVTEGRLHSVFVNELPVGTNPYSYLSVPLPKRARTQAFNRALNKWLSSQT